jgi:hypothetical protein
MSRALTGKTWSHVPDAVDDVGRLSNLTTRAIKPRKKKKQEEPEPTWEEIRPAANNSK